jgi:hypothetical protein
MEKMENVGITLKLYGGIAIALILVGLGMYYIG